MVVEPMLFVLLGAIYAIAVITITRDTATVGTGMLVVWLAGLPARIVTYALSEWAGLPAVLAYAVSSVILFGLIAICARFVNKASWNESAKVSGVCVGAHLGLTFLVRLALPTA